MKTNYRKTMSLKYSDLQQTRNRPCTIQSCLSEFIDNSISSFEKTPQRWDEQLNIDIVYNNSNHNNSFWSITDNANGIEFESLENCMDRYNTVLNNDNNNLNQYGIGMKTAIFWLGKDGLILTKTHNDDLISKGDYDLLKNIENNTLSNIVNILISKNLTKEDYKYINEDDFFNYKSGTKIIVKSNYTDNDRQITTNRLEEIKKFLGYRYYHYLIGKQFKVNINFKVIGNKTDHSDFYNMKINSESIFDNTDNTYKIDNNKFRISELDNIKQNLLDEINKRPENKEELMKLCDDLFNGKILKYDEYFINFTNTDYKFPIKWKILNKPSSLLGGVCIKHKDRYIHHPTLNKKDDIVKLYKWTTEDKKYDYFKWLHGELNLSDIPCNYSSENIKPDENKVSLINTENATFITKENLQLSLHNFIKKIYPIITAAYEISKLKETKEAEVIETKKEAKIINDLSGIETDIINVQSDGSIVFDLLDKKVKLKYVKGEESNWILKPNSNNKDEYLFNENCKLISTSSTVSKLFAYLMLKINNAIEMNDKDFLIKEGSINQLVRSLIRELR